MKKKEKDEVQRFSFEGFPIVPNIEYIGELMVFVMVFIKSRTMCIMRFLFSSTNFPSTASPSRS